MEAHKKDFSKLYAYKIYFILYNRYIFISKQTIP